MHNSASVVSQAAQRPAPQVEKARDVIHERVQLRARAGARAEGGGEAGGLCVRGLVHRPSGRARAMGRGKNRCRHQAAGAPMPHRVKLSLSLIAITHRHCQSLSTITIADGSPHILALPSTRYPSSDICYRPSLSVTLTTHIWLARMVNFRAWRCSPSLTSRVTKRGAKTRSKPSASR